MRGAEGGGRLADFGAATGRRRCRPAGRAAAAATGVVGGEGLRERGQLTDVIFINVGIFMDRCSRA